ncbi:hypothetical protein EJ04DRAFT_352610 [Polyplosphaeria fusca]|uniref:Uncharacterized protein n=1 Tax=Polyplosphaeria fusca TaxID=682080 RepID=A0A9P4UXC4_9PLEO|nr:hypothetical protein EJ04DRAFT_352610 [Polyplosphaeria fusca]
MKLNDALRNGIANMNPIDALGNWQAPYNSETSLGGRCWSTSNANCSWGAFNTLALCSSMQDVSRDITLENKRVSLPALKDFLQTDSEAPSFRSGLHGYTGENNRYAITYPPTSASDGANLPALAEVYYLFYDSCVDRDIFDLSNTTFWKAYKGTFQFCAQTINATTASPYDDTFTSTMTLIDSTTNLKWTQKTQYGNISHFCTALDGEEEDFCVSEPFMQRLAFQMNLMFNSTAIFRNANRTDIRYSSEWGPLLADLVYENGCDPIFTHDIKFQDMLEGIGQSLTDKFRVDANVTDSVFGTFTHAERVIKVDFRWLILPIVLWVIITIFFFSTMVKTRHTPMWKSSVLPLLHMMRSEDTPAEDYMIKKEAAETWVGLTRTQKGWRVWNSAEEGDVNKEGELRKRRAAAGSTDGGGNN